MSDLESPRSVFTFGSILYREGRIERDPLIALWTSRFGTSWRFEHSFFPMKDYYAKEMGPADELRRFFILTPTLSNRERLVEHKRWADHCERDLFSDGERRFVNIDVGALSVENLQLATGKNFTHRVYLRDGVYSDLTLVFQGKSFQTLPWTYPDYAHPDMIQFFNWARRVLMIHLSLEH